MNMNGFGYSMIEVMVVRNNSYSYNGTLDSLVYWLYRVALKKDGVIDIINKMALTNDDGWGIIYNVSSVKNWTSLSTKFVSSIPSFTDVLE